MDQSIIRCPNCGSANIRQFTEQPGGVRFGCVGCLGGLPLAFVWPLTGRRRATNAIRCVDCGWTWRT